MNAIGDMPSGEAGVRIASRVCALDWDRVASDLDAHGHAMLPKILSEDECRAIASLYGEESRFRSRVIMASHGFGQGEYKYFSYPLPALIAGFRSAIYARLAPIANRWNEALGLGVRFPSDLEGFLNRCHEAGQTRPTPLLLSYGEGDYNCLHQDLYGEHVFPLQATLLLSSPGDDFTGGEFLVSEQRPRRQSRAEVIPLTQGDAVIFAVNHRPVKGARGFYRGTIRHGVSRLRSGHRRTLGLIFHDAQ